MSKKCLVLETLNNVNVLESHKGTDGFMRLTGVFGVCGVKNENGRVYEKRNYAQLVTEMQNRISTVGCPGELEHPNSMNLNLENISHKIENIQMQENGEITGTIVIGNTPKGKIAQSIVEMGLPLFISSRGRGSVDNNGNVVLEELKTYDLVGTPGFSQAMLKPHQVAESLNESLTIVFESEEDAKVETIVVEEEVEAVVVEEEVEAVVVEEEVEAVVVEEEAVVVEEEAIVVEEEEVENKNNNIQMNEEIIKSLMESNEALVAKIESIESKYDALVESISNYFESEVKTEIESVKEEAIEAATEQVENFKESVIPAIESWITEEYSPMIQGWITEEVIPTIGSYITEVVMPTVEDKISESKEVLVETKTSKLASIDETIALLEGLTVSNNKNTLVVENKTEQLDEEYSNIDAIQKMPLNKRAMWNMASKEVKESIIKRSKIYNFTSQEITENFWNTVDFSETSQVLVENKQVADPYENRLRASLRMFKK